MTARPLIPADSRWPLMIQDCVSAGEQFPIFTAAVVYITSPASSGSRAGGYLAGAGVAHEPGHADRSEL